MVYNGNERPITKGNLSMLINITGHHVEITDGIREAIHQKFEKLSKHFPDAQSIQVTVTVEKHEQIAEATTHFLGKDLTAKASNAELYKSIAEMTQKLTAVMQRQKDHVKGHPHEKPATENDELLLTDDIEELID